MAKAIRNHKGKRSDKGKGAVKNLKGSIARECQNEPREPNLSHNRPITQYNQQSAISHQQWLRPSAMAKAIRNHKGKRSDKGKGAVKNLKGSIADECHNEPREPNQSHNRPISQYNHQSAISHQQWLRPSETIKGSAAIKEKEL